MYVFLYRYIFEKWLTDINGKYRINVEKFVEVMLKKRVWKRLMNTELV